MFENLSPEEIQQLVVVILLAFVPVILWSIVLFRGRKTSRIPLVLSFFLGTLTVIPLMALNYLWLFFPDLDVYRVIEQNIDEVHAAAFVTLVVVAITEEFAKSLVVRFVDTTKIKVQTVNDAVRYSILAGLGFAFTENIFYFFYIWQSSGFVGLLFPMIFRSIFTVAAHMVFSGIFGYYYGVAKFSSPIMERKLWLGEKSQGISWMSKFLGTDEAKAHREFTLLKGLFIAMIIHTFFNFFLEFQMLLPTIAIVVVFFGYLLYLLNHKAGAIAFAGMGRSSSMAKTDTDVVLELLGMWTREGKYQDVIDICQRLLMRDPDNKVVQLFQAKAMDSTKLDNLEHAFTSLFQSSDVEKKDPALRTLIKQKVLMEMLKEKQHTTQVLANDQAIQAAQKAKSPPPLTAATPAPVLPIPGQVAPLPEQQIGPSSPPSSPAASSPGPSLPTPGASLPTSEEDPPA